MKPNYVIIPLITVAVAILGGQFTSGGMDWYRTIRKPDWTPPGSLIGTVWTILYTLATVSVLIVWNKFDHDSNFRWIIGAFVLNAILNMVWSYLFFRMHCMGMSTFEAGLLGLSVVVLVVLIWPRSILAAGLLVPYAAWVFFATFLNWRIYSIN